MWDQKKQLTEVRLEGTAVVWLSAPPQTALSTALSSDLEMKRLSPRSIHAFCLRAPQMGLFTVRLHFR